MNDFYQVTVDPSALPVTKGDVKKFVRIDDERTDDDSLIDALIPTVVNQGEAYTNRCFVTRTVTGQFSELFESQFEAWPYIQLRRAPLVAVTSVKILVSDVLTDVDADDYDVKDTAGFARILFKADLTADETAYPLQVVFTAGYGTAADVPDDIKTALMAHIGYFYENRGDVVPDGKIVMPLEVQGIYSKYRILNTFG